MNKVILMGNITHDLELKQTPNWNSVLWFSIAANDKVKKGEVWEDEATFINIVAWGNKAEAINKFFSKWSKILIEGKIKNRSWEAQDGSKRYKTEILLTDFEFTSGSNNQGQGGQQIQNTTPSTTTNNSNEEISVDDLPF